MEQLNKQVEFLEDKSSSGKVRDWSGKKKRNLSLAEILKSLDVFLIVRSVVGCVRVF